MCQHYVKEQNASLLLGLPGPLNPGCASAHSMEDVVTVSDANITVSVSILVVICELGILHRKDRVEK